ncbi:PepSY domain-containing protein [Nocardioides sp. ChNu-153]|uniref:PepSY domain-containing protein n=1 Tax=unclassified Nocardioides TaxID=2615069 RepID=UPI00240599E5|nr:MULTISPECIES: PepSY domain-containing protein [unclassified Nocardioides]MDF9718043.1 PepSY domain-containing protein [Nocardioides sp. ChNu-99]MDN7121239.1 PepSY domain-containing protein [Nocardioides sp. ChNu-153]
MSIRDTVRTKRVVVPTIAAIALVGAGGLTWAAVAGDDDTLSDSQRTSAEEVALEEVGGGRVLDVDVDDETDESGVRVYELEVVDADGARWDVVLDEDFSVLTTAADRDEDHSDDDRGDRDDTTGAGTTDAPGAAGTDGAGSAAGVGDDAPIAEEERTRVVTAAEAAVEGGTAVDVDRSDDAGEAFEVEVVDVQGQDWDVTLDADLQVVAAVRD